MRNLTIALLLLLNANVASAVEKQWFVSVYGEIMQLASGAAAKMNVTDDNFLADNFKGKEIYVRVKKGYELDQFRASQDNTYESGSTSVSESVEDSIARSAESQPTQMTEFGPLADSGLQYYFNDDYRGWFCPELFVTPLGDLLYKLRCKTTMQQE